MHSWIISNTKKRNVCNHHIVLTIVVLCFSMQASQAKQIANIWFKVLGWNLVSVNVFIDNLDGALENQMFATKKSLTRFVFFVLCMFYKQNQMQTCAFMFWLNVLGWNNVLVICFYWQCERRLRGKNNVCNQTSIATIVFLLVIVL